MPFYSNGILAAAYRKQSSPDEMRNHAVCDVDLVHGRLKRKAGQALCNKNLNVDEYNQDVGKVDCPRCLDILKNIGVR